MNIMFKTAIQAVIAALGITSACSTHAQGTPPHRIPTYKCVIDGKTSYSDEPCIGAKVVDTTPTQGLDKMTGQSKKGVDVRNIEFHNGIAKAIQPLTGQTPEQFTTSVNRVYLPPEAKRECTWLDEQLKPRATHDETNLYLYRKRFKELKC